MYIQTFGDFFNPAMHNVSNPLDTKRKVETVEELYPDAIEDLPSNAPGPCGYPVQVNCFVDSDQAGDKITRRSQSGILLYNNSAPIVWHSKDSLQLRVLHLYLNLLP